MQNLMQNKKDILLSGSLSGRGGIQTTNLELKDILTKNDCDVDIFNDPSELFMILQKRKVYDASIFSSYYIFYAPFIRSKIKIFNTHGFYLPNSPHRLKAFVYPIFLRFARLMNCVFIAPSPMSLLVNSYHCSDKVYCIPWGYSESKVAAISDISEFSQRDIDILFIGRFTEEKVNLASLETIIKFFLTLRESLKISIAGAGSMETRIMNFIEYVNSTYQNRVIFSYHGSVTDDVVRQLMNSSKFFINMHPFEAFGLSLLDAAASGMRLIIPLGTGLIPFLESSSIIPLEYFLNNRYHTALEFKVNSLYDSKVMAIEYRKRLNWQIVCDSYLEIIDNFLKKPTLKN
ncbi:glycosyltransferase [Microcystis aeruginosa]|jgi:glycosyltransferase involved in cell wall biosynthesis|uniref:glycosyltransferase n=1 Tax=Microcystis aeruginosa TaxID=1126 RepID=UPI00232B74A7|nr:glycosyltransferase [Microcystis aeruginosa]MDB9414018.1 glycosyltransferase [Microcystis aeruginosa CS-567/02]